MGKYISIANSTITFKIKNQKSMLVEFTKNKSFFITKLQVPAILFLQLFLVTLYSSIEITISSITKSIRKGNPTYLDEFFYFFFMKYMFKRASFLFFF